MTKLKQVKGWVTNTGWEIKKARRLHPCNKDVGEEVGNEIPSTQMRAHHHHPETQIPPSGLYYERSPAKECQRSQVPRHW